MYVFLEREKGREKEREIPVGGWNIDQLLPICTPSWHRTCNPGRGPDQESNPQPVALRDDAQPTEPHWPGLVDLFFNNQAVMAEIQGKW